MAKGQHENPTDDCSTQLDRSSKTRSFTTAEGPRDAMPVKILSNVETSCTTKSTTNRSNGVRGLQLTDVK